MRRSESEALAAERAGGTSTQSSTAAEVQRHNQHRDPLLVHKLSAFNLFTGFPLPPIPRLRTGTREIAVGLRWNDGQSGPGGRCHGDVDYCKHSHGGR